MNKKSAYSDNFQEPEFRAFVVHLVLDGKVEKALELLARQYRVSLPKIEVGLPRSHGKNVFGCYTTKNQTIYVLNSEIMKEPFVVLHEFYHHLRTSVDKKHRGTEKYANAFAKEFIEAYKSVCARRVSGS
jgi:Zn-dependent peptidase ImmA (M78 family)